MIVVLACSYSNETESAKTNSSKGTKKAKPVRIMVVDTEYSNNVTAQTKRLLRCGAVYTLVTNKKADISEYDGLLIPGGGDINPRRYGAKNTASEDISNAKDRLQIYWVKQFMAAEKPILGVCRGSQIINVTLGGTLKQDISGHSGEYLNITFSKKSWLRKIYGASAETKHYHHQICKKMGKDLIVTSRSTEGYVEGFQHKTLPIYGVQWHPDHMSPAFGDKVYREFLRICRKKRAS